jgi:predicted nucleotidyltransferase
MRMELTNLPKQYREDIETATALLKREGCGAVYLFGSMVTGKIHEYSDIDLGIKGLPGQKFFSVYSKLYGTFSTEIHLIDFDLNDKMYSLLDDLGEVVQIG